MTPPALLCRAAGALLLCAASCPGQLRVVASSPTIADLVRQVGGEHVAAESIMRGPENPHHVTAKPSFVMKLRRADMVVHTGLDAVPGLAQLHIGAETAGQEEHGLARLGVVAE